MAERYVEKYGPDQAIMTGAVLLELAQSHKLYSMKRHFSYDIGTHDKIKVSREDIENMADTLKFIVFYVPCVAYREAEEIARARGVFIE